MTSSNQSSNGKPLRRGRRGNNEGTIRVEPNGKFRAVVSIPGAKRISKTFSTKAECREWMREINNQVAEGLNAKTLINTVQCYPTAWLDNIQTNKKGPLGFSVGRPYMGGSLVRQNSDILQYPGRDVGTRL